MAARAVEGTGKVGKVFATGFALPGAIKSYLEDGSEKAFALWNPYELGYVATYATHLVLAGKLKIKEGETFEAGKAGKYTVGKDGEIVYGKPMVFTKETVDKAGFWSRATGGRRSRLPPLLKFRRRVPCARVAHSPRLCMPDQRNAKN